VAEMNPVDSESIEAVGFDAEMHELFIRFRKSGLTYVYYGVEELVFHELLRADSKGAFFNLRIKPNHEFAKLGRTYKQRIGLR
jgi:hypothetical protein